MLDKSFVASRIGDQDWPQLKSRRSAAFRTSSATERFPASLLPILYKFWYTTMMANMKRLEFLGDSLEQLREFPFEARKEAGVQLHKVQLGLDPSDWRPMSTIGPSVREIRLRDKAGAFRVVYVMKSVDAVYVLHAFHKTTQRTEKRHLDLVAARLRQV